MKPPEEYNSYCNFQTDPYQRSLLQKANWNSLSYRVYRPSSDFEILKGLQLKRHHQYFPTKTQQLMHRVINGIKEKMLNKGFKHTYGRNIFPMLHHSMKHFVSKEYGKWTLLSSLQNHSYIIIRIFINGSIY